MTIQLFARHRNSRSTAIALLAGCAACMQPAARAPQAPKPVPSSERELPALPIEAVSVKSRPAGSDSSSRITLNSSNADLRQLLPLLANAAGVNLVMGPDVSGRVTVHFQNVAAIDALRAVIEQAGLTVGDPALTAPWEKPVFYDLPVNVNQASAATIRARFDVSKEMADWVVTARTR